MSVYTNIPLEVDSTTVVTGKMSFIVPLGMVVHSKVQS